MSYMYLGKDAEKVERISSRDQKFGLALLKVCNEYSYSSPFCGRLSYHVKAAIKREFQRN